ncbi:MAG: hypothetical protein ACYC5Y_00530 [Symbiobacteriia bacterium]
MKSRLYIALALAAGILVTGAFFLGRSAAAAGTTPGSDADPVVAKSYVDQYVQWNPILLTAGQTLTAQAGAEIVLRSGKAAAVETTGAGLSDVTGGKDLLRGTAVPLNHLLVAPRTDGRGIKVAVDSWVLVRGPYTIS